MLAHICIILSDTCKSPPSFVCFGSSTFHTRDSKISREFARDPR